MTKSFEFVMKLEVKNTSVLNDQKKIKYNCKDHAVKDFISSVFFGSIFYSRTWPKNRFGFG